MNCRRVVEGLLDVCNETFSLWCACRHGVYSPPTNPDVILLKRLNVLPKLKWERSKSRNEYLIRAIKSCPSDMIKFAPSNKFSLLLKVIEAKSWQRNCKSYHCNHKSQDRISWWGFNEECCKGRMHLSTSYRARRWSWWHVLRCAEVRFITHPMGTEGVLIGVIYSEMHGTQLRKVSIFQKIKKII